MSIRVSLPCSLLLAVPLLAAPQSPPNLMASVPLPDVPALAAAAGTQRNAAMARGDSTSLLVFEDDRAGDRDVYGLRLDATGAPLDPVPFVIHRAPGDQTEPRVAWNGQNWLVCCTSQYDPGSGYFASRVEAVRVSPQGAVLDGSPMAVAADGTGASFAVASDGSGWVVAYTGYSAGNSDIRARRISATGAVLDPGGVVVQPASYMLFFRLAVNFAGGSYLFSWEENGLRGRRFTPALAPVDAAPVALPGGQGVVAGAGSQFLLAWIRQNAQFAQEVVVQRLGAALAPLDPGPVPLSDPQTTPYPSSVSAVWDGAQWVVAWVQPATDARAGRFSSGGAVLDPGGVVLPDQGSSPLYGPTLGALPGGGAMHLWHEARFGAADDVYGVSFAAAGQPGAERMLSAGGEAQRTPRVGAAGHGYLVTALGERSSGSRILAWRVDGFGQSLDAVPIEVASAGHALLQVGGSAWNGSHHLVVWADGQIGQIRARRLRPDGTWIDPAPIAVMPGFAPDVASAGADFLVTGLRYPSYPQFVYSFGARVRGSDGAVLDNPALLLGPSFARRARVVELGGRWLVATQSHWTHDANQGGIALHLVDTNGAVTPATTMAVLNMQGGGIVDLASAGTSALVAAQTGSNWTNAEILVQRVLPDGTSPAPMLAITNAAGMGQSRPSVLWNGREYVVTYETFQNNVWFYDFEPDVYGIRVTEAGQPIDATGHAFWNGPDHEVRVDGDGRGHGKALYAASVYDHGLAAMRVQLRVQRPAGLLAYGSGAPGCFGEHLLDANSAPVAGNAGFALLCDRGPANGLGILAIGTGPLPAGLDLGLGFLLWVDPFPPQELQLWLMPIDPAGVGAVAIPLPAGAAWHGYAGYAQGVFLWDGTCLPSASGFSASAGLEVRIQAP